MTCAPDATRLYRARRVLPLASLPIEDGGLAVRGNEILAVGEWKALRSDHSGAVHEDLGEVILLPGLINAHCHLDYTMMRGALSGERAFADWIRNLTELRRSLDQGDYLEAIAGGLAELRQWGCTTVLNIESFPELLSFLPPSPIRVWWFLEMMDVRSRIPADEIVRGVLDRLQDGGAARVVEGGFGLSPHAPYTTTPDLYRLIRLHAEQLLLPVCTHLAESEEESAMFRKAEGPLYEFLRSLGRPMEDCRGITPLQAILGEGLLSEGSLLVHMNHLEEGDREVLRRSPGRHPVIHCPRTHAFFHRAPFDLSFFRENGIPVLLGTDSLASNQDLDMFSEMRAMATAFPGLDPMEILDMATRLPAASINQRGRLGELSPGALADFITVEDPGGEGSPVDHVLANTRPPQVWISGRL